MWECGKGGRVASCEIFCNADNADVVAFELILSEAESVCHAVADFSTKDARKGCKLEAAAMVKGDWC